VAERHEPVFWARVQPLGAARNVWHRLELTGQVESFNYEDDESKADKLELVVNNFDLGHFDDPVWRAGTLLQVSWGYPGRMAVPRTCIIRKIVGFQRLTISADGKEIAAQRERRFRVWDNVKRSDAVRAVAEALGFGPDLQHIEDTIEVHEQVVQANLTDAEFLRRMAEKEGFQYFVDFDGFHFHKRNLRQNVIREFTFYNTPRFHPGDVLEVSVDADVTAKPGRSKVKGRSPKDKKDIEAEQFAEKWKDEITGVVEVVPDPETGARTEVGYSVHIPGFTPEDQEQAPFEAQGSGAGGIEPGAPDPSLEPGQPAPFYPGDAGSPPRLPAAAYPTLALTAPPPQYGPLADDTPENPAATAGVAPTAAETDQDAEREATKRHRRAKRQALKISVKVVGDPTILAKSVFQLKNVGKLLSQRYYARSVKHSLSSGGYTCEISATADGGGGAKNRSTVVPGFSAIGVRAAKTRKPKKRDDIEPAPADGIIVTDPDTGQQVVRYSQPGERSPLFVAVEGHNYSDPTSQEVQYADQPPIQFVPPAGAGGTGGGGPPPEDLTSPEEGSPSWGSGGGGTGSTSTEESQVGGGGAG
jgi:phage protein D